MEQGYAMAEAETNYGAKVEQKKPAKRPGFLTRFFLKKVTEGIEFEKRQNQEQESIAMNKVSTARLAIGNQSVIDSQEKSIRFTVHVANGGRVIETQRYDRHRDKHSNGLYVITNEQDFGKEIDKIITMESLK